jgi:hypothetical protein
MCQSVVLSHKGKSHISYCTKCKTFYIWQDSFLLSLGYLQFESFVSATMRSNVKGNYFSFPDGDMCVLIDTPCPEIVFVFNENEWNDFSDALSESTYMSEIYQMMSS